MIELPLAQGSAFGQDLSAALASIGARPAVAIVTEQYLAKSAAAPAARCFEATGCASAVRRVMRAALQTGLNSRDVAAGVMSGVLRNLRATGSHPPSDAQVRRAAATVMAASVCCGSREREAIDGILGAVSWMYEADPFRSSTAVSAAAAGIAESVDTDPPAMRVENIAVAS